MIKEKSRSHRFLLTRKVIEAIQNNDFTTLGYGQFKEFPVFRTLGIKTIEDYVEGNVDSLIYVSKCLAFYGALKVKPFDIHCYPVVSGRGFMSKDELAYKAEDLNKLVYFCKENYNEEVIDTDIMVSLLTFADYKKVARITMRKRFEKYLKAVESGCVEFEIRSVDDTYKRRKLKVYSLEDLERYNDSCKKLI